MEVIYYIACSEIIMPVTLPGMYSCIHTKIKEYIIIVRKKQVDSAVDKVSLSMNKTTSKKLTTVTTWRGAVPHGKEEESHGYAEHEQAE